MRQPEVSVSFQPAGRTVHVLPGTRLMEAAAVAGLALDMPCGGQGTCGKCRVIVRRGAGEPNPVERALFGPAELASGHRLACQTSIWAPMTVETPESSLLGSYHKILVDASAEGVQVEADAALRKRYVELPPPARGADQPDLARLQQALGPLDADLELLRELPGRLRAAGFRGTAVLADGRLLDFEPDNTEGQRLGAAFDVGTTTLVGQLVDLGSGRQLAVCSRLNPQTAFGDDVLSRIVHGSRAEGLAELQSSVIGAINEMLGELAAEAGVLPRQIYELTFSGNTTMQHLLCGIDPRPLGEVPFVPATGDRVLADAGRFGLGAHPRARVYVLPVIGGFVGGDTVAGILATGMAYAAGPTLLVDIGTNGEIVLAMEGRLSAASTAAGPAFEGARISQGMRGSAGAIEKVVVDGRLQTNVIGGMRPVGLCGSALIDLAAELLRHGVLSPEGRLRPPDELPADLLADLRARVVVSDGKASFVLADEEEAGGRPVVVTQRDFRELQLAAGAIRAGIRVLLKRNGLAPCDLEAVLVAGGFGNFIRRSNAQRIGLLPHEIPRSRIRYQGNTSLAGARLVAISRRARALAEDLARRTQHVDLAMDEEFRWTFAESMIFPDNNEVAA